MNIPKGDIFKNISYIEETILLNYIYQHILGIKVGNNSQEVRHKFFYNIFKEECPKALKDIIVNCLIKFDRMYSYCKDTIIFELSDFSTKGRFNGFEKTDEYVNKIWKSLGHRYISTHRPPEELN